VKRPQSNGIVEGRRTWFETIEEMQGALDEYLVAYNARRPHEGLGMNGRTPEKAFIHGLPKETKAPTSKPRKAARKPAHQGGTVSQLPFLYIRTKSHGHTLPTKLWNIDSAF